MGSPLPTIAVTGRYVDLANKPANGYVLLTPLHQVVGQGWLVVDATLTAYVRDGQLNTIIIADSDMLSQDLYVRVTERIGTGCDEPVTYIVKPDGATLDLTTAPRIANPPPGTLFIPATALGQPGGVATLGTDGKLTFSQRPPGGGGGVTSHHDLTDLATGDDHPQYLTPARADIRYVQPTQLATVATSGQHSALAGLTADDHPQYLTNTRGDARYVRPTQLAAVATTGAYNDLTGTPAIPATYTDLTGLVPTSALPALAINDVFTVTSEAEMLALAAQRGDLAVRTDLGAAFILSSDDPMTLADWIRLPTPADAVVSVNSQTGVVVLSKADVGLGQVADLAPADLPVSTAAAAAISASAATRVPLDVVDAAGDLIVGTGDGTVTRLPQGADTQILTVQSGSLAWSNPPGPTPGTSGGVYPPATAGYVGWTIDPLLQATNDYNANNGVLLLVRTAFTAPGTFTMFDFGLVASGASPGAYSGAAVYSDGQGVVTRLSQTADIGTVLTTAAAIKTVNLTTPVTVAAGDALWLAFLSSCGTAPRIAGSAPSIRDFVGNTGKRRSLAVGGQTAFPATFDVSTAGFNNASYFFAVR